MRPNRIPMLPREQTFGRKDRMELHDSSYDAGPTRLMARSYACAVVAMKILIEENIIAPMRIGLKFFSGTIDGSSSV